MSTDRDSRRHILDMLADNRLTVEEAESLLAALDSGGEPRRTVGLSRTGVGAHLRVLVTSRGGDDDDSQTVNVRVPVATLRAGLWLPALLPEAAAAGINKVLADRGIGLDVRKLRERDVDRLVETLRDLEIDITSAEHRVLVFVE